MTKLDKFLNQTEAEMLTTLEALVKECQQGLTTSPEDYTEPGTDEPSIDLRLCIDLEDSESFVFRVGSSDFDPYHSEYCAASCITTESEASELLQDLVNQLEDSSEPEPDFESDAFIESTGPLGSRTSLSIEQKFIGEYSNDIEAIKSFKEWCAENSYFPTLWSVSDHGNVHLVDLTEEL